MVAVDCTPDLGCVPPYQWSIIPVEYQGWALLIFLGIAGIALLWGFYFIATVPVVNTFVDKLEPKKRKFYDKIFAELMFLLMLGLLGSFIMMRMGI